MFTNTYVSRHTSPVGIFDSMRATKTHNCVLEGNQDNHATCWEHFVIPQPTFYKPIIEVQMPLHKTDGCPQARAYNISGKSRVAMV